MKWKKMRWEEKSECNEYEDDENAFNFLEIKSKKKKKGKREKKTFSIGCNETYGM